MTIETIVQRVIDLSALQSHLAMPIKQRCLDAINELLQETAPQGHDAQAEIHALAEQIDTVVTAAQAALEPTKEEPTGEI